MFIDCPIAGEGDILRQNIRWACAHWERRRVGKIYAPLVAPVMSTFCPASEKSWGDGKEDDGSIVSGNRVETKSDVR